MHESLSEPGLMSQEGLGWLLQVCQYLGQAVDQLGKCERPWLKLLVKKGCGAQLLAMASSKKALLSLEGSDILVLLEILNIADNVKARTLDNEEQLQTAISELHQMQCVKKQDFFL